MATNGRVDINQLLRAMVDELMRRQAEVAVPESEPVKQSAPIPEPPRLKLPPKSREQIMRGVSDSRVAMSLIRYGEYIKPESLEVVIDQISKSIAPNMDSYDTDAYLLQVIQDPDNASFVELGAANVAKQDLANLRANAEIRRQQAKEESARVEAERAESARVAAEQAVLSQLTDFQRQQIPAIQARNSNLLRGIASGRQLTDTVVGGRGHDPGASPAPLEGSQPYGSWFGNQDSAVLQAVVNPSGMGQRLADHAAGKAESVVSGQAQFYQQNFGLSGVQQNGMKPQLPPAPPLAPPGGRSNMMRPQR